MNLNEEQDIIISYNGKKYILVDNFNYKDDMIYYFLNEESELFCKKDNNYNVINDINVINEIKKDHDLLPKEFLFSLRTVVFRNVLGIDYDLMNNDEKNSFINSFINVIKEYSNKETNIDINRCIERLKKIQFFKSEGNLIYHYHPATDSVLVPTKFDSTAIHELIHAMAGPLYNLKNILPWTKFFIEGITESTTRRILAKENEGQCLIVNGLRIDLPESNKAGLTYSDFVVIIRQMEVIQGYHADSSMINGNNNFINDFMNKYGPLFLVKMGYKLSKFMCNIDDIQNSLLTKCFETDLKKVKNEEEIKDLLIRLRKLSQVRGKRIDGSDKFYDEFYNNIYNKCMNFLSENNLNNSFMSEYKDVPKEHIFYPKYSFKQMLNEIIIDVKEAMDEPDEFNHNLVLEDLKNMKIKYKRDKCYNYVFYVLIDDKIVASKKFDSSYSIYRLTSNIDINENDKLEDLDLEEFKPFIEKYVDKYSDKSKRM